METEDYASAARYISKFRQLDHDLRLRSMTAGASGTAENPVSVLRECERRLRDILLARFDAATAAGDDASVEQLFRLLPLVGLRDEGLGRYARYLCVGVAVAADRRLADAMGATSTTIGGTLLAELLMRIFEDIARAVQARSALVTECCGADAMVAVVQQLQRECDIQSGRILMHFSERRQLARVVGDVAVQLGYKHRHHGQSVPGVEPPDPRDLDGLLDELALIINRSEAYARFLRRHFAEPVCRRERLAAAQRHSAPSHHQSLAACASGRGR